MERKITDLKMASGATSGSTGISIETGARTGGGDGGPRSRGGGLSLLPLPDADAAELFEDGRTK